MSEQPRSSEQAMDRLHNSDEGTDGAGSSAANPFFDPELQQVVDKLPEDKRAAANMFIASHSPGFDHNAALIDKLTPELMRDSIIARDQSETRVISLQRHKMLIGAGLVLAFLAFLLVYTSLEADADL
jgi:hypothetical protein